ncbi:MAG: hypothetical protein A4E65_00322 [Syntrophorhabdus sp. PtaU1.Bin153]|nr:MAG: hypothetical protein A4E65_00322 [Syntrophorhabdus sp. PtaU1.Bin153]
MKTNTVLKEVSDEVVTLVDIVDKVGPIRDELDLLRDYLACND